MFIFKRKFKRTTTTLVGVFALASFLGLAVWGWGVPAYAIRNFFLICVLFLLLILIIAAVTGLLVLLLRKLKNSSGE